MNTVKRSIRGLERTIGVELRILICSDGACSRLEYIGTLNVDRLLSDGTMDIHRGRSEMRLRYFMYDAGAVCGRSWRAREG